MNMSDELKITPDIWWAGVGTPLQFLQWRALIGRAAGYEMEFISDEFGFTFEIPKLSFQSITLENTLGYWEKDPDDIIDVLLYHMSDQGILTPRHAGLISTRLIGLIEDSSIARASYHGPHSLLYNNDFTRTEQVATGLKYANEHNVTVEFCIK